MWLSLKSSFLSYSSDLKKPQVKEFLHVAWGTVHKYCGGVWKMTPSKLFETFFDPLPFFLPETFTPLPPHTYIVTYFESVKN